MNEQKRKVKIGRSTGFFPDGGPIVMTEIELPALTAQDRYKLSKAQQIMEDSEANIQKRRALDQLNLHENAEKAIRLQKELDELRESYRIIVRDYNALLERCAILQIENKALTRPTLWDRFSSWLKRSKGK